MSILRKPFKKQDIVSSVRKGDVIVRTIRASSNIERDTPENIKIIKEVGHKKIKAKKQGKNKPLSMDGMASIIMQRVFFNKDMGVNLVPNEYDQLNKIIKFKASSPDGKINYGMSFHVLDLQTRIDKGVIVSTANL